jgi:ABC-type nitrate/sulfonate/bicarbonate transport system substrate-binding protein
VLINRVAYSGVAVAAVVAIGSLAGCSAGASAAADGHAGATLITGDTVPPSEAGGLYVAAYEGFFAQQGLTVKIKPITGGEAGIPDLQAGRADLVAGNYVSFILAQLAGKFDGKPASMRIIAAGSELQPGSEALYVMPDSKFKTVASLGKYHARVGLNTPNDVGDVMVGALLEDAGYTLKDISQVIPAGGFPALLKLLPAGKVDAIWLPEPLGRTSRSPATSGPRNGCGPTRAPSPRSCARWPRARSWPTPTARRWSRRWRSTPASRPWWPTTCRSTATR